MPSPKILANKKKIVTNLSEELKQAQSLVFTDYKGLTVAQDTEMRAEFRKAGVTYRVVKNTVSSRAFDKLGIEGLEEILKGPTAIAYSTEDVVTAPRLVKQFADKFRKTTVKGGILDGAFVPTETVQELASIPAMDVLYTQLVSTLLYPITRLAITLNLAAEKHASDQPADEKPAEEATDAKAENASEVKAEEAAETTADAVEETVADAAEKAEDAVQDTLNDAAETAAEAVETTANKEETKE